MNRTSVGALRLAVSVAWVSLAGGCGGNSTTKPTPDTTSPSSVASLAAATVYVTGVTLTWNAPGDDGTSGTASSYDVRYSAASITDANFSAATPVTGQPAPAAAGTLQSMVVLSLAANTSYYFAIRAADEASNVSAVSNVVTATTLAATGDVTPPAAAAGLAVSWPTPTSLDVSWTAPGDDGTTGNARSYDLRYSTSAITAANFAAAAPVIGEPSPEAPGTVQTMTVSGLASATTYYFALETSDEVPNVSALSIDSGTTLFTGALFRPGTSWATAAQPVSVAIGDVNGDAHADLVLAASHAFSVLLGNGGGAFETHTDFGAGGAFGALAQLDGDATLDLVAASGNVSVMLGNGNGTFGSAVAYTAGGAERLAVADLNADGRRDVVTANLGVHTVSVLMGNGDGTLGTATDYAAGNNPADVAIADLNADGKPDLAVACRGSDIVAVMLGNGNGTFAGPVNFTTGRNPVSVAIADLNADGKPDLALAVENGIGVSVLLGNGKGTFQTYRTYVTSQFPSAVAVGDVNGDGKPDLVTSNGFSSTASVLLGNGDGTFAHKTNYPTGTTPAWVALGDLQEDGRLDIATADLTGSSVTVLLNLAPPVAVARRP